MRAKVYRHLSPPVLSAIVVSVNAARGIAFDALNHTALHVP